MRLPRRLSTLALLVGALLLALPLPAQDGGGGVVVARLADAIHPITAEFVIEAVAAAERDGAALFVLQVDTPGGLDSSMRDIIQAFLGSGVPICLYVGPSGARAASAGFFMAMAADVVAMAPGTNMGAASPVALGGAPDETMQKKLMQDAEAYIRSLADGRERPGDLAAEAVTEGRSFSAAEAIETGLADFLAADVDAVVAALQGRAITKGGRETVLDLQSATRTEMEMSVRQKVLAILANPQVAYVLMLIGLAGLYFELSTPGAILPGVLGGISLILALLAFQVLPISYAGLALIALAVLFFILEIKVTSYGALTVAGLVAFVLGSLMLVPGPIPEMRLQLDFVLPLALGVVGLAAFLLSMVIRTHRGKVLTGDQGMVGAVGVVRADIAPPRTGAVFVRGELWRAVADEPLGAGTEVEVTDVGANMELSVRIPQSLKGGS